MMKLWLARDDSGYYSLFYLKPTWERVHGTRKFAWYAGAGEPVGWRNMCAEVTHGLLGGKLEMIAGAEPVEVEAFIVLTGANKKEK